jgi:hypothetical protein
VAFRNFTMLPTMYPYPHVVVATGAESGDVPSAEGNFRADLTGLSSLLGENADLLGQLVPRVRDLDETLADLAARVDAVTGPAGGAPAAAAGAWPSLSAAPAAPEWQALGAWVARVFGPFYGITGGQLPDCWALHPPAVLELMWLRRTYVAAHGTKAAATAAAEWHTRWRREALANIPTAIPTTWCRPGEHYVDRYDRAPQPPPPPRPVPEGRPRHIPGERPGPGNTRVGEVGEITTPQHCGPNYQTARNRDLAWRRHREAAAAAANG